MDALVAAAEVSTQQSRRQAEGIESTISKTSSLSSAGRSQRSLGALGYESGSSQPPKDASHFSGDRLNYTPNGASYRASLSPEESEASHHLTQSDPRMQHQQYHNQRSPSASSATGPAHPSQASRYSPSSAGSSHSASDAEKHDRTTHLPPVAESNSAAPISTCANCKTTTTPLWRRDDDAKTLCNACGLFLKMKGRPRPVELRADVIKSRNRGKAGSHSRERDMAIYREHETREKQSDDPPVSGKKRKTGATIKTIPESTAEVRGNGMVTPSHQSVSSEPTLHSNGSHMPVSEMPGPASLGGPQFQYQQHHQPHVGSSLRSFSLPRPLAQTYSDYRSEAGYYPRDASYSPLAGHTVLAPLREGIYRDVYPHDHVVVEERGRRLPPQPLVHEMSHISLGNSSQLRSVSEHSLKDWSALPPYERPGFPEGYHDRFLHSGPYGRSTATTVSFSRSERSAFDGVPTNRMTDVTTSGRSGSPLHAAHHRTRSGERTISQTNHSQERSLSRGRPRSRASFTGLPNFVRTSPDRSMSGSHSNSNDASNSSSSRGRHSVVEREGAASIGSSVHNFQHAQSSPEKASWLPRSTLTTREAELEQILNDERERVKAMWDERERMIAFEREKLIRQNDGLWHDNQVLRDRLRQYEEHNTAMQIQHPD